MDRTRRQDAVNSAVDMYLKQQSKATGGRVPKDVMLTIFEAVDAPWMTRSMIYNELAKRRRQNRHSVTTPLPLSKVEVVTPAATPIPATTPVAKPSQPAASHLPPGVPSFIFVDDDDRSQISSISEPCYTLPKKRPRSPQTEEEVINKHLMDMTKDTAARNYMNVKAQYREEGKKVPQGELRKIILLAAQEHRLSSESAMGISCRSIRNRAATKERSSTRPDSQLNVILAAIKSSGAAILQSQIISQGSGIRCS